MATKDKPWMMRTYAGHSSASASNELFRRNLEKGQTHVQNVENKATADGTVTKKEAGRIEHAQDQQSKKIYREKHDRQHDYNHDGKNDRRQRKQH